MPKHNDKTKRHLIYLAEHIGEDNNWEWWDVYDSEKWTIYDVFDAFISDFQGESPPGATEKIKREGQIWTHADYDYYRVWEAWI